YSCNGARCVGAHLRGFLAAVLADVDYANAGQNRTTSWTRRGSVWHGTGKRRPVGAPLVGRKAALAQRAGTTRIMRFAAGPPSRWTVELLEGTVPEVWADGFSRD